MSDNRGSDLRESTELFLIYQTQIINGITGLSNSVNSGSGLVDLTICIHYMTRLGWGKLLVAMLYSRAILVGTAWSILIQMVIVLFYSLHSVTHLTKTHAGSLLL